MESNPITFKDFYLMEKNKPTPAQIFINEIAELTKKSVNTVRMWIQGRQHPDALAKSLIAEKFGVDPETLFPQE